MGSSQADPELASQLTLGNPRARCNKPQGSEPSIFPETICLAAHRSRPVKQLPHGVSGTLHRTLAPTNRTQWPRMFNSEQ
jgi:hypothetical protein